MSFYLRGLISSGFACCLFLSGAGFLQGQEGAPRRATDKAEGPANVLIPRASIVIGARVRLGSDVMVGKVEDIVLNDQGCVDYAVVVYEDKYVLVPWTVTRVDYADRIVSIDITKERFLEVPTFTREHWPNLTHRTYTQKVRTFFAASGGAH